MADKALNSDILLRIRQGDESAFKSLYQEVRPEFIAWSSREYGIGHDDAIELFQLAMVIFYDNVITGKLIQLTTHVKTYVFAIAKNKARELRRKQSKTQTLDDTARDIVDLDETSDKIEKEARLDTMRLAMNRLGQRCQDLLRLFYYQKLDMASIAQLLQYSSKGTAKNMKYKCLQQLRKLMT